MNKSGETVRIDKTLGATRCSACPMGSYWRGALLPFDLDHPIENFLAKLKQFWAIATRYDKAARNFLAGVHLAATVIWLK